MILTAALLLNVNPAHAAADAAKADNRIKPLLPDIRRTAPADNPAA